ncbi:hypothetical protein ABT025_18525 [Streptomyces sp. NPDC002809]|uniref:hypothetical protein n=1 Tax=Streptomyces sp. NPDC002809 TaxID=3154433 RepID=UPI00331934C4
MTEYEIACLGKKPFPSRASARRRARQIRGEGGPAFRDYRCQFCWTVHLGHTAGHATYLRAGRHGPIPVQEYAA